ncbi:MAG: UDP-N-acetylmuramoyl-L-alanyl-D-glutamate--2,6-diaminopimelate ligase [Candidatus Marinimicrobia bacterium]|nr:UDP-N-acetylmuramoyl-L-alanyl-D-glutamate--2,6-diaminopimelate ligase [Candidatus Neomarinimicrobiota bacterium]MCK4447379.1 UDP-N-acetylmuramoyl-L-alanyl-D-glutamate--2,6-diaminopimelate ligase [Candidatus Neomarinimicrobiota bacterium]
MNKSTQQVLKGIAFQLYGNLPESISSLTFNSKNVQSGSLFFAIRGQKDNGHKYIPQAIKKGASAVVVENIFPDITTPQIKVTNTRTALSHAAANYYDNPSKKMTVVGITGTNGKTTVVYLLNHILKTANVPRGTIGTLGYSIGDENFSGNLTTPESVTLQKILYKMTKNSISTVIMEVSSHALALRRVEDITFIGGVFTNLSQDHLDFHLTMESYAEAKTELFRKVIMKGFLVCNIDDHYSEKFMNVSKTPISTFSINKNANFKWSAGVSYIRKIEGIILSPEGKIRVDCPLSGEFNLKNILAAIAVAINLGIKPETISQALSQIESIPGRLQEIYKSGYPRIFVDYAHTPDAIKNVLETLKEIIPQDGKLIALFGCGGNRDRKKRPLMAKAVESFADFAVVTDDNPRFEDPQQIIQETVKGFSKSMSYKIINGRKKAIMWTLKNASINDIIALLGKGHEIYQEINGKRYPFNEVLIVKDI